MQKRKDPVSKLAAALFKQSYGKGIPLPGRLENIMVGDHGNVVQNAFRMIGKLLHNDCFQGPSAAVSVQAAVAAAVGTGPAVVINGDVA